STIILMLHGLHRNRWADGSARVAALASAVPVSSTRPTLGLVRAISSSSSRPVIPGIWTSETTTAHGASARVTSASAAEHALTISNERAQRLSARRRPETTSSSSSTSRMRGGASASLMVHLAHSPGPADRERHDEPRAHARGALEPQHAGVARHDVVRDREPLPGAAPDRLGGEERIEDPVA